MNTGIYLRNTALCAGAAIAAVAVYALRSTPGVFVRSVGLASGTALAAFWLVGIIGFLFGIPPAAPDDKTTNQSLEQIADWLTKIIIGASLVELRAIGSFVADIGDDIGTASKLAAGPQLFTVLIVAAAASGFIFFYFWAYMYWDRLRKSSRPPAAILAELEQLKSVGLISDAEFASKRQSVLNEV